MQINILVTSNNSDDARIYYVYSNDEVIYGGMSPNITLEKKNIANIKSNLK